MSWYQIQIIHEDGKTTQLNFEYEDEKEALNFFDSNELTTYIKNSIIGHLDGTLAVVDMDTGETVAQRPYHAPQVDQQSNWDYVSYILVYGSQVVAQGSEKEMKELYKELDDEEFRLFKMV